MSGTAAAALLGDTKDSEAERLVAMLHALGSVSEAVIITILGEPIPKPRHRTGQGRAYSTPTQRAAEERIGLGLRQAFSEPLDGNLALAGIYYRSDRGVVDRDNLGKLVQDAGNGIGWRDDAQFTAGAEIIELDRALPRSVIAIARHRSSLIRE
jgi:Holliday junction resolvase RusA-like endonuclease